jgi:preprotein translocase subunit SecA
VIIPTNNEMIRKDYNDQIFRTENEKNNAIIEKIVERHNAGQPILILHLVLTSLKFIQLC